MSNEPKRLYEMDIRVKFYVAAGDPEEAAEIAQEAIESGDVELRGEDVDAFEVTEARFIEKGWRDSVPFGGELNCLEHFEARERYERGRPRTLEELEEAGQQSLLV